MPQRQMLDVPKSTQNQFATVEPISPLQPHDTFTIMSFNVLAQTLVRRELFPTTSQQALKWPFRRETLLKELAVYGSDILCLQEVDFFEEFWKPKLMMDPKFGYGAGHWKKKNAKLDGVAVFWRKSQFSCVAKEDIEFDDYCKQEPYANNLQGSDLSELLRGNVATILALKRIDSPESPQSLQSSDSSSGTSLSHQSDKGVIVFNTHLFWNPKYNYVRLVQCVIALQLITQFKQKHGLDWPVIMCGDYNHSSGDPSYEAMFERTELVSRFANESCWFAPKLHYSKYQSWIVTPAQAVLDAEDPQPKPPHTEEEMKKYASPPALTFPLSATLLLSKLNQMTDPTRSPPSPYQATGNGDSHACHA